MDTGTATSDFPPADVKAINALFDPPATFNATVHLYTVQCDANAPELGIEIGAKIFYHNPRDLILPFPGEEGICVCGVKASLAVESLPILCANFLKKYAGGVWCGGFGDDVYESQGVTIESENAIQGLDFHHSQCIYLCTSKAWPDH